MSKSYFTDRIRKMLQNKVYDGGIADVDHQLFLPANNSDNLDSLDRKVGAVAYDTELEKVVYDDGSGFAPIAENPATPGGTTGAVQYKNNLGNFSGDGANLFYDDINDRLAIGSNSPQAKLDITEDPDVELLRLSNNSGYIGFKTPSFVNNVVYNLPDQDGSNGQSLTTDGSGNLSWASSGGGGLPAPISATNDSSSIPTLTMFAGPASIYVDSATIGGSAQFVMASTDATDDTMNTARLMVISGQQPSATGTSVTGGLTFNSGDIYGVSGFTGEINIGSGGSYGSGGNSGEVFIFSGDSDTGDSGTIGLQTGEIYTTGNSGGITLRTGESASGDSGNIILRTGVATASRGYIDMNSLYVYLPRGTSDPTAPAGSVYYNTGTNKLRLYDGTSWVDLN